MNQEAQAANAAGLYEESLNEFRQLLEGDPGEAYRYYGLTLLYSLADSEVVRERYRLGTRPMSARALYNLGVLCSQQQEHEQALQWYEAAEAAGTAFPELLLNLHLTHQQLGHQQDSVHWGQRFLELAQNQEHQQDYLSEIRSMRSWLREQGASAETQ